MGILPSGGTSNRIKKKAAEQETNTCRIGDMGLNQAHALKHARQNATGNDTHQVYPQSFTGMPIIPLYLCVQLLEIIKCGIGFVLLKQDVWVQNVVRKTTEQPVV